MAYEFVKPTLSYLEQRAILRTPQERRLDLVVSSALLLVVLAAHGASLWDGLFLDDHGDLAAIRKDGWGLAQQMDAASFELPGHVTHLWWQDQPLLQRHARPVAMFFLKVEYILSGGRPALMHLLGLFWHFAACALVFQLARWLFMTRAWAFMAGSLFAVNPHSVFTVGWISSQGAMISTCFLIGAVLAYASASTVEKTRRSRRSHRLYQAGWSRVRLEWLAFSLVLWGLALFSWETAVIFPLIVLLIDLGYGRRGLLLYRLPIHVALWSLMLSFVYWRAVILPTGTSQIPSQLPAGMALLTWSGSKLIQMVFALMFGSPMFMGIATVTELSSLHVAVHILMVGLIVVVTACYEFASRGQRCRLLWPAWALAGLVVTIPGFILPQFGYLPFVGYAIMMAVILARFPIKWRSVAVAVVVLAMLVPFGLYRRLWRGIVRSEQLLYADVISAHPRPMPGSKVFFINLPIVGLYAPLALREAWGLQDMVTPPDLAGDVLTFARHPLVMDAPCVVEPLNDHELLVSTQAPGYFGGLLGRMVTAYTRPASPLTAGTVIPGDTFDTTIVEADPYGVRKLKFTFLQPLSSSHYYFYIASAERPLFRRRFNPVSEPMAEPYRQLFAQARSAQAQERTLARRQLGDLSRPLAVQAADPIQTDLADLASAPDETVDRIERWWNVNGACLLIAERQRWMSGHRQMLAERNAGLSIAGWFGRMVQSDLFLTGEHESPVARPRVLPAPKPAKRR